MLVKETGKGKEKLCASRCGVGGGGLGYIMAKVRGKIRKWKSLCCSRRKGGVDLDATLITLAYQPLPANPFSPTCASRCGGGGLE